MEKLESGEMIKRDKLVISFEDSDIYESILNKNIAVDLARKKLSDTQNILSDLVHKLGVESNASKTAEDLWHLSTKYPNAVWDVHA